VRPVTTVRRLADAGARCAALAVDERPIRGETMAVACHVQVAANLARDAGGCGSCRRFDDDASRGRSSRGLTLRASNGEGYSAAIFPARGTDTT
jgi:hypothetical protein